jgi:hypothetical protein
MAVRTKDTGVGDEREIHQAVQRRGSCTEEGGWRFSALSLFTVNCPVPVIAPNTFTG